MKKLVRFLKEESFLALLLVLLGVFSLLHPSEIPNYIHFVHWATIVALSGLLIITTGLKESGYFSVLSKWILNRAGNERRLAIFLIFLSAFLSTFLTNDITLFVIVPLTIAMKDQIENEVTKLIIFEVISVNVGSSLTPIGNPQNLFLWHKWGISFIEFIVEMIPLVLLLFSILLIFAFLLFPQKGLMVIKQKNRPQLRRDLFYFSLVCLIAYLISLDMKKTYLAFLTVLIFYFFLFKDVLLKADWALLLIFITIFIDFHFISTVPLIRNYILKLNLESSKNIFLLSLISSQLISNVPASVFVSKFSNNWFSIAYGVNVGGNGLIIGSLANIIALRIAKDINPKRIWIDFHIYSIPYLLVTGAVVYLKFL